MPSLPDNDQSCNPHLAALVAINIVTEVVDEAQDILNTANDSGQPWRYVWQQRKGNGEFYENAEILGMYEKKDDVLVKEINEINKIDTRNIIVTSTPQKETDGIPKTYENSLIGQGDEDIQTLQRNNDLQSPSMLISCLFDMSELEQSANFEDPDDIQRDSDSQDFIANSIAQLIESYVNLALDTVPDNIWISDCQIAEELLDNSNSSYSMLADVLVSDVTESENEAFYVDSVKYDKDDNQGMKENDEDEDQGMTQMKENEEDEGQGMTQTKENEEIEDQEIPEKKENAEDEVQGMTQMKEKMVYDKDDEEITKKDIYLYEKTFSTLNRDYEKYSDEVNFCTDQNNLTMQDVELTRNKSFENIAMYSEHQITKEAGAVDPEAEDPAVSAAVVGNHKNSLVKRCRLRGARLMSRLRSWWWKQRLIGKRKGGRSSMSGICPLSPNARNRAVSLMDHRQLRSPSPSRTVAWKFNTINESLIPSYKTKEFDFESSGPVEED